MFVIDLSKHVFRYDENEATFIMSEKGIPFGTSYEILNPKTGNKKKFELLYSTGPEFDAETRWVYINKEGIKLEICNDAEMTKIAAENYLSAKLAK